MERTTSANEARTGAVYGFTQAIQPGGCEEARAIFEEIQRDRREEYEAARRRLGIR